MEKIKVLVADDHTLFREALCPLLKSEEDMDCVALAKDGEEAVRLAKELLPDVALIDIEMPKMDGIEAAKQIKTACPATAVIMVSGYKYAHYILASVEAGVDGYLLKHTPRRELINAIRMVHYGQGVFSLEATAKVLRGIATEKSGEEMSLGSLHPRELEVLKMTARGMTNKEIAAKLCISPHTVGTHLVNIFRKLGVDTRTEATLYTLKEGLLTVDDLTRETRDD
jgi:DNA-binding NarL/FixJ family response regulator